MRLKKFLPWVAACTVGLVVACANETARVYPVPASSAPARFILTFDDGPDGRERNSPTTRILNTLANNPTQKGIKAIFFVQTRSKYSGATPRGHALLARENAEGQVLALHDGSTLGHPDHCNLSEATLEQSLSDGLADLRLITGRRATLLRPPYWAYNERTLAAYARHDLAMLLTDISANDGKTRGFHGSPRRRSHMASEMARVRQRMQRGEIPEVDRATPLVVTFHDTNDYTAAHMQENLKMLVDEARAAGITLAAQPFYADSATLERAALVRAHDVDHRADMVPGWWRWLDWMYR